MAEKIGRQQQSAARWLPVTVTATSPLTVTLPDGASVQAIGIAGLTYSASTGQYIASWQPGSLPVVFPTA